MGILSFLNFLMRDALADSVVDHRQQQQQRRDDDQCSRQALAAETAVEAQEKEVHHLNELLTEMEQRIDHMEQQLAVKDVENRRLQGHVESLERDNRAKARYVPQMQAQVRHCEAAIAERDRYIHSLQRQAENLEEEKKALSKRVDALEVLHASTAGADASSYEDLSATPPMLQAAADCVKDAIAVCASDLFKLLKKKRKTVMIRGSHPGFPTEWKLRPSEMKLALQGELSQALFAGFENQAFGLNKRRAMIGATFAKPPELKQSLFEEYLSVRYMDTSELFSCNGSFQSFVRCKTNALLEQKNDEGQHQSLVFSDAGERKTFLAEVLLLDDPMEVDQGEAQESSLNGAARESFKRLAKAVWLLHLLAFAFKPTVEIVRVPKGSVFDLEYMRVDEMLEEEESCSIPEDGAAVGCQGERKVEVMAVPGFVVRNTIVKALVLLQPPFPLQ